jgi:hypothetical protein
MLLEGGTVFQMEMKPVREFEFIHGPESIEKVIEPEHHLTHAASRLMVFTL